MALTEKTLTGGAKTSSNVPDFVLTADTAQKLLVMQAETEKDLAVLEERLSSMESSLKDLLAKAKERFGTSDIKVLREMLVNASTEAATRLAEAAVAIDNLEAMFLSWPAPLQARFPNILRRIADFRSIVKAS